MFAPILQTRTADEHHGTNLTLRVDDDCSHSATGYPLLVVGPDPKLARSIAAKPEKVRDRIIVRRSVNSPLKHGSDSGPNFVYVLCWYANQHQSIPSNPPGVEIFSAHVGMTVTTDRKCFRRQRGQIRQTGPNQQDSTHWPRQQRQPFQQYRHPPHRQHPHQPHPHQPRQGQQRPRQAQQRQHPPRPVLPRQGQRRPVQYQPRRLPLRREDRHPPRWFQRQRPALQPGRQTRAQRQQGQQQSARLPLRQRQALAKPRSSPVRESSSADWRLPPIRPDMGSWQRYCPWARSIPHLRREETS